MEHPCVRRRWGVGGGPAATAGGPALPLAYIFPQVPAGLTNGRELETLLGQFLAPIIRLAGAQAGLVRTLSDDGEQLRLVGEIGLPPEVRLAELTVGRHCGTCGIAADNDALTWAADLPTFALPHTGGDHFGPHAPRPW